MPDIGNFGLIDLETPTDVYTIKDMRDGDDWQLVFSDEFNTDGRTFWPGDDPYWEAVDLHYWGQSDMYSGANSSPMPSPRYEQHGVV